MTYHDIVISILNHERDMIGSISLWMISVVVLGVVATGILAAFGFNAIFNTRVQKSSTSLLGGLSIVFALASIMITASLIVSASTVHSQLSDINMRLYEIVRNPAMADSVVLEKLIKHVDLSTFDIEQARQNTKNGVKNGESAIEPIKLNQAYIGNLSSDGSSNIIIREKEEEGDFQVVEKRQPNSVLYNDMVRQGLLPEPADGSVKKETK